MGGKCNTLNNRGLKKERSREHSKQQKNNKDLGFRVVHPIAMW